MKAKFLFIAISLLSGTCGADVFRLCSEPSTANEERFVVKGDLSKGFERLSSIGSVEFKVEILDPRARTYLISTPKTLVSASMPCVRESVLMAVGGGVEGGG